MTITRSSGAAPPLKLSSMLRTTTSNPSTRARSAISSAMSRAVPSDDPYSTANRRPVPATAPTSATSSTAAVPIDSRSCGWRSRTRMKKASGLIDSVSLIVSRYPCGSAIVKARSSIAIAIFASTIANCRPMQARAPLPNGFDACG